MPRRPKNPRRFPLDLAAERVYRCSGTLLHMATFTITMPAGKEFHTCVAQVAASFIRSPESFGFSYGFDGDTAQEIRGKTGQDLLELLEGQARIVNTQQRASRVAIGQLSICVEPGHSSSGIGWREHA